MRIQIISLAAALVIFAGCGSSDSSSSNTPSTVDYAYLGDRANDKLVKVNMTTMTTVTGSIDSGGSDPYEVQSRDDVVYAVNRADYQINLLNFKGSSGTESIDESINLPVSPRSILFQDDEAIVSSTSDAEVMLVDLTTNTLVSEHTDGAGVEVNYGGSYKSGHPLWVSSNTFLLSDRSESSIELYHRNLVTPISKITLPTSVHHILYSEGFYYAAMEGKTAENVSPGVIKFHIVSDVIIEDERVFFSSFSNLPVEFKRQTWGGHHLGVHAASGRIFMGSREGNVFVLNTADLSLNDVFKAGTGAGHVLFTDDLAIITNHYDEFKTVYDLNTGAVTNIVTNTLINNGNLLQSHSSWVKDNKLYFIASSDKKFVEVDLDTGAVTRTADLGNAYCLMGTIVSE